MPASGSSSPFRRRTDPVMVAVGIGSAESTPVPEGWITPDCNAFCVVNSSPGWVRLRGFRDGQNGQVEEGKGWLFPPGHIGVYATQQPQRMSALAVERPGFPVTAEIIVPLEVSYGDGL